MAEAARLEMLRKLTQVYDTMANFQPEDGQTIPGQFIQLPSKAELPDYYEIIENPMDFNRIKEKLDNGQYPTPNDFAKDVYLMTTNAQTYHVEGSEICKYSTMLETGD